VAKPECLCSMVDRVRIKSGVRVEAVTTGPKRHFFGYYGLTPWDGTGRYMLALESDFDGRTQHRDDVARIGLIDTEQGNSWRCIAETRAWNWQQGCMLQWMPNNPNREIIYNDFVGGQLVAVVRDVFTGTTRLLPKPICAVCPDGRQALTLNYGLVHRERPGYGYVNAALPARMEKCPTDDGIYWMDLATGENHLIITVSQLDELRPIRPHRAFQYVCHLLFNTDGSRFVFFHRWQVHRGLVEQFCNRIRRKLYREIGLGRWVRPDRLTRMLTARPDGSDIRVLCDDDLVSHFDWKNADELLVFTRVAGVGDNYYVVNGLTGEMKVVGRNTLTRDGHPSYSPDGRWIVTDSYPDPATSHRTLILYLPERDQRVDVASLFSPPVRAEEFRCDLHPRWNRDGTKVCIDSLHEGTRQVYVLDVSQIVGDTL